MRDSCKQTRFLQRSVKWVRFGALSHCMQWLVRTRLSHGMKYLALLETAHGIGDTLKGWAWLNTKVKPDPFGVGAWNQIKLTGGRHECLTGKELSAYLHRRHAVMGLAQSFSETQSPPFFLHELRTRNWSHSCSVLSSSVKLPHWSYVQNQVVAYCPLPANFVTPPFPFFV